MVGVTSTTSRPARSYNSGRRAPILASPPCDAKNARSAFRKLSQCGRLGDAAQRAAAIVFDRQHAAGFERGDELAQVRFRVRQEQEHPPREDQIVGAARQRRVDEIGFPDRPWPSPSRLHACADAAANGRDRSTASIGPRTRRRSSMCSEPLPGPTSSTRQPGPTFTLSNRACAVGSHNRACRRRRAASRRESPRRYRYSRDRVLDRALTRTD